MEGEIKQIILFVLSRNKTNKKNDAEDKKLDQDCINKLED